MRFLLTTLDRALTLVERACEWLIAALVLVLVAILALKLIDRHFVDIPIAAPDEYAKIALVWVTFIGFALALRSGANIRVDLIEARLPPGMKRVLDIVFDVVLLVLLGVIMVKGWKLIEINMEKLLLGTDIPESVPAGSLFAAGVLMVAFIALRLIARLTGTQLARREDR